jgi:hypothetical protein
MKSETPLFKAFTYHNGGQRLRDIADNFGNISVSRWTIGLVMAASAAISAQPSLHGKQGFRELADSMMARTQGQSQLPQTRKSFFRSFLPTRAPRPE